MATPNESLALAFVKATSAYVKKASAELTTLRKSAQEHQAVKQAAEKGVDDAVKALLESGLIKASREQDARQRLGEPVTALEMLAKCARIYHQERTKQANALGQPAEDPSAGESKQASLGRSALNPNATAALYQTLMAARARV